MTMPDANAGPSSMAPAPIDENAPNMERRRSVVRVRAELTCLVCGRDQGVLEAASWPPTGPVKLHPVPGQPGVRLDAAGRLHCVTCGGRLIATEVTSYRVWIDVPIDWQAERPRRGRPPKRLVAQRAAGSAA
jgi:hypothetical protein